MWNKFYIFKQKHGKWLTIIRNVALEKNGFRQNMEFRLYHFNVKSAPLNGITYK